MQTKKVGIFILILLITLALLAACTRSQPGANADASINDGQTGVAELDRIIDIVLGGDIEEQRSLLEFSKLPCTLAEGLGGPPKCQEGEQEGTIVDALPFLGPEGHFLRKQDIDSWSGLDVSKLYAAYEVSDQAYTDASYPAGEFAIVFLGTGENPYSITLQIRDGRIIRIDFGFGDPPTIRDADVARYLVEPGG